MSAEVGISVLAVVTALEGGVGVEVAVVVVVFVIGDLVLWILVVAGVVRFVVPVIEDIHVWWVVSVFGME